jgi:8-oxo-dGTP diphosphatase
MNIKNNVPQLATLCYVRKEGKTLMLHRNKIKSDIHLGKWNGLGGKFETGESPDQCIIREVFEESGFIVENPKVVGFLTFPNFTQGFDWYVFVYVAENFKGELTQPREGTLSWIADTDILNLNLWEGDTKFIPYIYEGIFFTGLFKYNSGMLESFEINVH